MSHNVHASHVSCRPSSAVSAGIGHSSFSGVAVNNSGSNNMNLINSQQTTWVHSTNGPNQNAAGLVSNQHGAAPRTPSGGDYDKATTVPSPQSSSGSQGTTLKEHDLLGLSDVSSTNASRLDNSPDRSDFPHEGLNLNLNLGATELRLGPKEDKLNPGFNYNTGGAVGVSEQGPSVAVETGKFLKLDAGAKGTDLDNPLQQHTPAPAQDESPRSGFTISHTGNFQGARNVFHSSKSAVSGAKRPYDTIGTGSESRNFNESRVSPVSESPSMMNTNSVSSDADAKSKAQPPSFQSWSTRGPTWQMPHTGGSFGPFPSQAPGRSHINNKSTADGVSAGGDAAQMAWETHTKSLQQQDASPSMSQKVGSGPSESKPGPVQAPPTPSEAGSLPRAAAPSSHAVGWPPLRSYRKNSIAAHPRPSPVETQPRPPPPPPPQAASPASVASQPNSWFVKVYMDGVPFGRKVDLKTNRSYEKLSLVLEDMFRGFVNGQQSSRDMTLPSDKRNFLHGSDYVLTYEDQDGDLMLVGDVPWTMFIDTVKRLRIMKGSEAIGLGTRAAEKANKVPSSA